jgi:hypothetical protein
MRSLFLAILLLPLAGLAAAQQAPLAKLLSDPFVESYDPDVAVSGNVIVGVMTPAAASGIVDKAITVRVGEAEDGANLCLRAASRDGIYTSKNLYALPAELGAEGVVTLPYPSTKRDLVREYGEGEMALTATQGNCDAGSADFYLPIGSKPQDASGVVVYVNSFGATDVFYEIDDKPVPCAYIDEGRRTTYDFVCRLDAIPTEVATTVKILRERFGREQPAVELRLVGTAQ